TWDLFALVRVDHKHDFVMTHISSLRVKPPAIAVRQGEAHSTPGQVRARHSREFKKRMQGENLANRQRQQNAGRLIRPYAFCWMNDRCNRLFCEVALAHGLK